MTHFVVIGAGIVGLATAHELTRRNPHATVTVLDKEDHVAAHQTGHNSGVIHAGVYYRPGSLKATLCRAGSRSMIEFCAANDIPVLVCGKLIVATTPECGDGVLNPGEECDPGGPIPVPGSPTSTPPMPATRGRASSTRALTTSSWR